MVKEVVRTVDITQVCIPMTLLDAIKELQNELAALVSMLQESDRMHVDSTKIPEDISIGGGEIACWV